MNIFEIQIPVIPKCFESISGFLSQWQLPMKVPWKSQLNISKNSIEYNFGCIKTVFGGSTPLLKNILTTIFTIFVCYCSSTKGKWIQIEKPATHCCSQRIPILSFITLHSSPDFAKLRYFIPCSTAASPNLPLWKKTQERTIWNARLI